MIKVESQVRPKEVEELKGRILINFNIIEELRELQDGSILMYCYYQEEAPLGAPKDLIDTKILKAKEVLALQYLDATDWYVTRFSETGQIIPEDIITLRAEARLLL